MRLGLTSLYDMLFHEISGILNDIKEYGKECKHQLLSLLAFNTTWFSSGNFLHMNWKSLLLGHQLCQICYCFHYESICLYSFFLQNCLRAWLWSMLVFVHKVRKFYLEWQKPLLEVPMLKNCIKQKIPEQLMSIRHHAPHVS